MTDLRAAMQRDGVARSGLSLTQLEALTLTIEAGIGDDDRRDAPDDSVARDRRLPPHRCSACSAR